ncbi:MAG: extracellular solute-binding protein, partial [Rhodospirillales bacterium]|nr:extracellular solute-binding protein [Rhodospirillales bacterium]
MRKHAFAFAALAAVFSAYFAGVTPVIAQSKSVVVYNAVSTKLMDRYVEEFQKLNPGVKVDVISGGSGELLTRIQAEKARPRGDVLVGPDADIFDAAIALFDAYKSTEATAFGGGAVHKDGKYYGFSMNFQ